MIPLDPGLSTIRKQYFSLYPPHLIDLKIQPRLSLARHQPWIVRHLVSYSQVNVNTSAGLILATKYPPADDYQKKFWKLLISALESELRDDEAVAEELELDDRIAEHYSELVMKGTCPTNVPGPSYKTYIYDSPNLTTSPSSADDRPVNQHEDQPTTISRSYEDGEEWIDQSREKEITLLEAQTTIEAGSTGLRTWTASLYLATKFLQISTSTLLDHPNSASPSSSSSKVHSELLRPSGRSVSTHFLELGSGTGFLACFLAQTGRNRTIWATDVGETDNVDGDSGDTEDDEGLAEGETDPTVKAKEVLRKGPIWGLRGNVEINRPQFERGSQVIPLTLDWYHAIPPGKSDDVTEAEAYESMVEFSRGLPDDLVILATDVIYDPDLVVPLCATLRLLLTETSTNRGGSSGTASNGRFVLLAATVRNQETTDQFYAECDRIGLTIEHIVLTPPNERGACSSNAVIGSTDTIFWNASVWEGGDVRVMKIWV